MHFAWQSDRMKPDQAAENLQIIRTLMERSAVYRRALAPIMTWTGAIGILAALIGVRVQISSQTGFIGYWLGVAIVTIATAFLLVRRQALNRDEPFWSPPTRRVSQALLPPLLVGLLIGLVCFAIGKEQSVGDLPTGHSDDSSSLIFLAGAWAVFYGCALHSAGFFVSRGLRLYGWVFVSGGCTIFAGALFVTGRKEFHDAAWQTSHWVMGGQFGLIQLAYGIYLYVTGEEQNSL